MSATEQCLILSNACHAGRLAKGNRPGEADSDLEDEFDDLRVGGKRKRAAAGCAFAGLHPAYRAPAPACCATLGTGVVLTYIAMLAS